MRWADPLDEILGSRAKVRILRCVLRSGRPMSAREIARTTGLSHTGALRALEELYQQDVVALGPGAGALRYRPNEEHVLVAGGLGPLFGLEASLDELLAAFVTELAPGALSITVFGSVARAEEQRSSDIDLLVVVPDGCDTEEAFDAIAGADALTQFGKRVQPVVWTVRRLRHHFRSGLPLLRAILGEGRHMWGEPVLALVHAAKGGRAGAAR